MTAPPRPAEGVVTWNITTACNYRCSYCTQRFKADRRRAAMPVDAYLAAFARLPGHFEIKLSGGEPFAHPGLIAIVEGLALNGHRVSVVTNFSASRGDLLAFADAARGRAGTVACSLHLEYVRDGAALAGFIDKARWFATALRERADPALPKPHLSVTTVATRAALPRLRSLAERFAAEGIAFKIQPEKQDREPVAYSPAERDLLLSLGGHNGTGAVTHSFKGAPCWAGARYFILDERGFAWRCWPARRFKIENRLDFLAPSFALSDEPRPCLYDLCHCTVPIARGMTPRPAAPPPEVD